MRLNAFAIAALVAALAWSRPAQAQFCPLPGQTGTCTAAATVLPLSPFTQPKFVNELPQPVFYQPRKDVVLGFDYYEVQVSPVTQLGVAFPQPGAPVAGKQWLGLCSVTPAAGQPCPANAQLFTPLWGYSQTNRNDALSGLLNNVSTYPSMSFRATKGTPVKVRWVNNLPNNHLLCPNPLDSNSPCAIDRTLMGTLLDVNLNGVFDPGEVVNQYGGPQQPDNAVVIHLHGGEMPPDSDGFAELWFGNTTTAAAYAPGAGIWPAATTTQNGAVQNIEPLFIPPVGNAILNPNSLSTNWNGNSTPTGDGLATSITPNPLLGSLVRPTGNSMLYNYPMVQDGATIWYHDHALGKTRINVVAGPAGYFYINDPLVDVPLFGASPGAPTDAITGLNPYAFGDCTDLGIVGGLCRDIPIVFQDRAFNADGSINFPNGLGQAAPAGFKGVWNPLTPGPVPTLHPQWVPEYFGDHAVINGVIWPKVTVAPTNYRFRLLDGSNARCWTLSMAIAPPAVKVTGKPPPAQVAPSFLVIASDQGYLPAPALTPTLTMCPGERYEAVIDFTGLAPGTVVNVVNTAGAPFPAGITPQAPNSPDAALAIPMQFVVGKTMPAGQAAWVQPATWGTTVQGTVGAEKAALAAAPVGPTRFHVLNEVLDPATKAPVRVQINGKPFEAPVTEIPKRGTVETWQIINTTVDAHPMHLHLVQFEVVSRQKFQVNKYVNNTFVFPPATPANPIPQPVITPINPAPFTFGALMLPLPQETGFKDTAISYPGEVLTVRAKWDGRWPDCPSTGVANPNAAGVYDPTKPVCKIPAATAATPYYQPVTSGPYVWHCHIVDHEDNEMMRPTLVMP